MVEKPSFKISDYQITKRDYSFIIEESQKIGEVLKSISNVDKNLIKNVSLFDIYKGNGIEKGKKSIALSVTIQSNEKTLTENDINKLNTLIIKRVEVKFKACFRED